MSSSHSWITSNSCSSSIIHSSHDKSPLSLILKWVGFIFLSPCPQRVLFASVDILFLFILFVFAVQKLYSRWRPQDHSDSSITKPLIKNSRARISTTIWFKLSLVLTAILALAHVVLCVLAFTRISQSSWELKEALFRLIQAVTYSIIAILIAHEKRFEAVNHPATLRIYWVVNFVIVVLFSVSSIIRLSSIIENVDPELKLDDILSLVNLPISVILLIVAVRGSTGIIVIRECESGFESESKLSSPIKSTVTGYDSASLLSKAVWYWMTPLLSKGYKNPLKMEEIPSLAPIHRAERMSQLFESNYPKAHEKSKHPVRTTLLRCFWKDLLFTAFLAIIRLCVMYMGPILLQNFVDFTSGKGSSPYEGYYLVLILLTAKTIEVLSSHQFNFHSAKLGMLIRSTMITSLYKKGLRLTSSSRQAHGLDQIVNYMVVDAQQLPDMMLRLHYVWLMPLQVGVALVLLYHYIGIATLATLVGLVVVMIFTLTGRIFITKLFL